MPTKLITITGGSGFVGQILQAGLRARGYRVNVYDKYRSRLVTLLRRRYLGTATTAGGVRLAQLVHRLQRRLEPILMRRGVIRPTEDDILDLRWRVAGRFQGSHAVIHLAGIAHPFAPGSIAADFQRINYEGSINVFEAARQAGVKKFLFASSAQVYKINAPVRIDQFPILESNYLPTPAEGQSLYGFLKGEFERYLAQHCPQGNTQGIALRLEYPGFRSRLPSNFYISTSLENLLAGVVAAIEAPDRFACDVFNLADAEVDPAVVDIQGFLRERWPEVPNHTHGNQCLVSTEKARRLLDYRPTPGGTYYSESIVW